jgi:hypothetical protein
MPFHSFIRLRDNWIPALKLHRNDSRHNSLASE